MVRHHSAPTVMPKYRQFFLRDAMNKVGTEGLITVEEAKKSRLEDRTSDVSRGHAVFDRGYNHSPLHRHQPGGQDARSNSMSPIILEFNEKKLFST